MWHRLLQLSDSDLRPCPGSTGTMWDPKHVRKQQRSYPEELIVASSLINNSWNYNLTADQRPDHPITLFIRYLAWFLAHLFPLSGRRIGSLALGVFCGSPVQRGGSLPAVADWWPHCDLKHCVFFPVFVPAASSWTSPSRLGNPHSDSFSTVPLVSVCVCVYACIFIYSVCLSVSVCELISVCLNCWSQFAAWVNLLPRRWDDADTVTRPHRVIVIQGFKYALTYIHSTVQTAVLITIKRSSV